MAYIYCIRHDNLGYIGKDTHSATSLERVLDHVNNAFADRRSRTDGATYTINKWGYSGNYWRINDDVNTCFGVGADAYQAFVEAGWTTTMGTNEIDAKLNFAEMVYTLAFSNSYAALNSIIGGTPSRGQTPWIYDLTKDAAFLSFQEKVKNMRIQVPSFSMSGKNAKMSLTGRSINWGSHFHLNGKELTQIVVHWQNIEDARTKLLHPYQYGVVRYICDSLSQFLSTDLTTLKYLIMKGIGCTMVADDNKNFSELANSVRQITQSIYTQIAAEAKAININFYMGEDLAATIFETVKPVVRDVVNRVNRIISRGITSTQLAAKQYREGIGRKNFTGNTAKVAAKTFKIRPSKGLFRIPTQQNSALPKWYKLAWAEVSRPNNWITIDETPDEIKTAILKFAYKTFKELVLLVMETVPIERMYGGTYGNEEYTIVSHKWGRTLLSKVADNWHILLGLPKTPNWPIAGRLLISTVMKDLGIPLHKEEYYSRDDAVLAVSDDGKRGYWFTPALWSEIIQFYGSGVEGFAQPENWQYF